MPCKDKAKLSDMRIWGRMGKELAALDELIGRIYTDQEYWKVMDCKTWDRLNKIGHHLDVLRAEAEGRMARFVPNWTTQTFYPHDRGALVAAVAAFRDSMKKGD